MKKEKINKTCHRKGEKTCHSEFESLGGSP